MSIKSQKAKNNREIELDVLLQTVEQRSYAAIEC